MDVLLIKVLDRIEDENEETGELTTVKLYLPTLMYKKDIEDVNPGVTESGKLYKNLSIIKKYNGDTCTVVGNYKEINKILESVPRKEIGYINGRK